MVRRGGGVGVRVRCVEGSEVIVRRVGGVGVRVRCVEGSEVMVSRGGGWEVRVRVRCGEREGVWVGKEGRGRMIGVGMGAKRLVGIVL